ncbi:glycoside hydrolase family 43 protein [Alteribacter keqinensis]|uniref:Family 43 glycosylhydrolase n=1 Tax=Alteribacter keqinensis TaxID=2483800 RepID=A0A3M7TSD8_9BACI|nr:glycoside hydrolase family 43 protein [Alteribacter keqinensis]RNA67652.1 hypothetical protein EBO34_13095 [Alteribacter keqinensis]
MDYNNPVIAKKGTDHGDPAVLKFKGVYYLYHTGPRKVPVYRSFNLVDWEEAGVALWASDDRNHWAQIDLWAPEVLCSNGIFYMYVTGATRSGDGTADDENRRIGVAKSASPTGPFILADEPLTREWSIDAHPFQDDDGTFYMYYNVRNDLTRGPGGIIGTGNVVDRMKDLETLDGKPAMVVRPEHAWEGNKEGTFFWNEGPFVLKHLGRYYQMYSAGYFGDDSYGMYYATSDEPMGEQGMKDTSWKKWQGGKAILKSNEFCEGPGHHVVTKGPDGVNDYYIYHGYSPDEGVQERRVRVGLFEWQDDHIWLEPPSDNRLPFPATPSVDARFMSSLKDINRLLSEKKTDDFYFETTATFLDKCAKMGVSLSDNIRWTIYSEGHRLVAAVENPSQTQCSDLPQHVDFTFPQRISLLKKGGRYTFSINGLEVLTVETGEKYKGEKVLMEYDEGQVRAEGTILTTL